MDKDIIWDKVAFVFHKIVFGVVYYGAFASLYKIYINIIKLNNGEPSFLGFIVPFMIWSWFFRTNLRKATWKPFGKFSNIIEISIIFSTLLVLSYLSY